ncbi:hypothetical protein RvY_04974 [Ramazzottius varieornatus]|uniref:K Homology domain-containing protein n=1 Tax=Ramazzottius varieornatus TaxID=947166 RepID=A0A1D1UTF7_RAMVA|nr:hypothetical protein RvY_04974 [Ramazzottius varieornatus]
MKENGEMRVFLRGPQSPRTLLGVRTICKMFSASLQEEHQVTQSICVHPNSQSSMWVFCDGERWLKMLSRVTGVQIAFPNPRGNNGDKQIVTISGSVHGMAVAWFVLMSMMPVALRLNIPPHLDEPSLRALHPHITKDLHVNFLAPRSVPASEEQEDLNLAFNNYSVQKRAPMKEVKTEKEVKTVKEVKMENLPESDLKITLREDNLEKPRMGSIETSTGSGSRLDPDCHDYQNYDGSCDDFPGQVRTYIVGPVPRIFARVDSAKGDRRTYALEHVY